MILRPQQVVVSIPNQSPQRVPALVNHWDRQGQPPNGSSPATNGDIEMGPVQQNGQRTDKPSQNGMNGALHVIRAMGL